jgi:hypothetical protein
VTGIACWVRLADVGDLTVEELGVHHLRDPW